MLNFLKQMFFFRMGQKTTRAMARSVGLGRFGLLLGLIGGITALRRHRRAY